MVHFVMSARASPLSLTSVGWALIVLCPEPSLWPGSVILLVMTVPGAQPGEPGEGMMPTVHLPCTMGEHFCLS